MANITNYDLELINQQVLEIAVKIEILNQDGTVVAELKNLATSGSLSIDSSSRVRRTFSATLIPDNKNRNDISENALVWLNKEPVLYIGIKNQRTGEFKWYKQGHFVYDTANTSLDSSNDNLQISCSDYMTKLDGTKNGQIGGTLVIKINAYEETGGVIKYNIIRDALVSVLMNTAGVTKFDVGDIGEYKGIEKYNPNFAEYRKLNPEWNCLPYDLEFTGNTNIGSIIESFIELYPNYDAYFNEDGVFIFDLIPSGDNDPIYLFNDQVRRLMISENTSTTLNKVKNICEVWGQSFDVDYYAESSTLASNIYSITLSGYAGYLNNDLIGFRSSGLNASSPKIMVNSLAAINIYNETTGAIISAGEIESGKDYVLKYKKTVFNGVTTERFYLMGQYQVHAINVLTDGTVIPNGYTSKTGVVMDRYSKKYFQDKYNCNSVSFTIIPDSPFTIQKIGEHIDKKNDEYYNNISSDSNAIAVAEHENWKNCRLTDSIKLTLKICPFLFENMKIEYQRNKSTEIEQFLIKTINHDFQNGTTSVEIMKYYPLYQS